MTTENDQTENEKTVSGHLKRGVMPLHWMNRPDPIVPFPEVHEGGIIDDVFLRSSEVTAPIKCNKC